MMKKLILLFLLIPTICQASPPARIFTYTTGDLIEASKNTSNEDAIFNYLSTGVDTIKDGVITTDDISASAAIPYSKLSFSNDITATDIATGAIGTTEILDATIAAIDIATGGVESTEILDGTILNIDVNASAGIVDTKLATISTAGKVLGAALNTLSGVPSGAGQIPVANLGTGTPSSSTFLKGDGAWSALSIALSDLPTLTYVGNMIVTDATTDTNVNVGFVPNKVILLAKAVVEVGEDLYWGSYDGTNYYACFYDDAPSTNANIVDTTRMINDWTFGSGVGLTLDLTFSTTNLVFDFTHSGSYTVYLFYIVFGK